MAAVQSSRQKVLNRTAVAVVVLLALVYLVPIYWITSTAFKPRSPQAWIGWIYGAFERTAFAF